MVGTELNLFNFCIEASKCDGENGLIILQFNFFKSSYDGRYIILHTEVQHVVSSFNYKLLSCAYANSVS